MLQRAAAQADLSTDKRYPPRKSQPVRAVSRTRVLKGNENVPYRENSAPGNKAKGLNSLAQEGTFLLPLMTRVEIGRF